MANAIPFFKDTGITIPYAASAKQTREITAKGLVWREMYLRLTGTLTVAAASNTVANTQIGDEWGVVTDLTLRINGLDVYKRFSGPDLRWMQFYLYGVFPFKTLFAIGDGATLNPAFDSTLILPFWMPKSAHPTDYSFDTSKVSRVDLEITWGTHVNINSAATGFTVNPQVGVALYEVANVGGNFARWNVFPITTVIAGSGNNQQIKIPVGFLYRSFLIHDVSAIITNFKIQSHPTEWVNIPIVSVRDVIGLSRRTQVVPTALANVHWLAGATGDDYIHYIYFDAVGHGLDVESIDTFGLSEYYLLVDTNGAGTITVYPNQLVVPRG